MFSGGGVGDLGVAAAGVNVISACEIDADRAKLIRKNHPNTFVFEGDIREHQADIIAHAKKTQCKVSRCSL